MQLFTGEPVRSSRQRQGSGSAGYWKASNIRPSLAEAMHRCKASILLMFFGSSTWARTRDLLINRPPLDLRANPHERSVFGEGTANTSCPFHLKKAWDSRGTSSSGTTREQRHRQAKSWTQRWPSAPVAKLRELPSQDDLVSTSGSAPGCHELVASDAFLDCRRTWSQARLGVASSASANLRIEGSHRRPRQQGVVDGVRVLKVESRHNGG